ncbi:hypothetical protein [Sediminicola sp. 1XM1-17]|uniref:hypothetical protein n=1 Tax=Sediminicola sp. 1XM1-17 TaxID=3127702 RepID=UPI0030777F23
MEKNIANHVKKGADKFDLLWDNAPFTESSITYEIIGEILKMTHKRRYKDD